MATLKLLYRAQDPAALRIRDEGRSAAEAWDWGANEAATRRFAELLQDPQNFPREVEPSPPLSGGMPTH